MRLDIPFAEFESRGFWPVELTVHPSDAQDLQLPRPMKVWTDPNRTPGTALVHTGSLFYRGNPETFVWSSRPDSGSSQFPMAQVIPEHRLAVDPFQEDSLRARLVAVLQEFDDRSLRFRRMVVSPRVHDLLRKNQSIKDNFDCGWQPCSALWGALVTSCSYLGDDLMFFYGDADDANMSRPHTMTLRWPTTPAPVLSWPPLSVLADQWKTVEDRGYHVSEIHLHPEDHAAMSQAYAVDLFGGKPGRILPDLWGTTLVPHESYKVGEIAFVLVPTATPGDFQWTRETVLWRPGQPLIPKDHRLARIRVLPDLRFTHSPFKDGSPFPALREAWNVLERQQIPVEGMTMSVFTAKELMGRIPGESLRVAYGVPQLPERLWGVEIQTCAFGGRYVQIFGKSFGHDRTPSVVLNVTWP